MGFPRDLGLGKQAEKLIVEMFDRHKIPAEVVPGKNTDYDLKVQLPDKQFTIEAKYDLYCARSGNIAIEFFNPKQGKPSGIGSTKADLWFHIVTVPVLSIWGTSVKKLKEYIASSPAHKTVSCGGDNNSSMYLYRKDVIFNDIFNRLDESDSVVLIETINKLLMGD